MMGRYQLDSCYSTYQAESKHKLLVETNVFGVSVCGDGATVLKTPLVNVLAAGIYEPEAVRDIIDYTDHMAMGGIKDARYLARQLMPTMKELNPDKDDIDMLFLMEHQMFRRQQILLTNTIPRQCWILQRACNQPLHENIV